MGDALFGDDLRARDSRVRGRAVHGEAAFGPLGEADPHRYLLRRIWDPARPTATWVLLNPSTATATKEDPTIRRCQAFARAWGLGGILVANLFAFRATDPNELYEAAARGVDVVGPENDRYILEAHRASALTIAAWGVHGAFQMRGYRVARALLQHGPLNSVGLTKDHHPRHPLYVAGDAPLIDYPRIRCPACGGPSGERQAAPGRTTRLCVGCAP